MSAPITHNAPKQATGFTASNPITSHDEAGEALPDLATYVTTYARQHPDVAALWVFGIGFVLGWKLKPW
jgi:hypothetical protein